MALANQLVPLARTEVLCENSGYSVREGAQLDAAQRLQRVQAVGIGSANRLQVRVPPVFGDISPRARSYSPRFAPNNVPYARQHGQMMPNMDSLLGIHQV